MTPAHGFSSCACACAGRTASSRRSANFFTRQSLMQKKARPEPGSSSLRELLLGFGLGVDLGVALGFGLGFRLGGLLVAFAFLLGLGFRLRLALGFGLRRLRVGAERERGRDQCHKQILQHGALLIYWTVDPLRICANNARSAGALTLALCPDCDFQPLHAVVAEARHVPRRLQRLHIAGAIGGTTGELVLAGARRPGRAPSLPRIRGGLLNARFLPYAVDAEFDARDRCGARPGASDDFERPRVDD